MHQDSFSLRLAFKFRVLYFQHSAGANAFSGLPQSQAGGPAFGIGVPSQNVPKSGPSYGPLSGNAPFPQSSRPAGNCSQFAISSDKKYPFFSLVTALSILDQF
jgi:hypothetical protein